MMISKKNRIKLTIAMAGVLLFFAVSSVQAFTVLQEFDKAYAILDLEIEGQAQPFNVEFIVDTADNVYGVPPTYDFTIGEVSAAVDAVNEALNSRLPTGDIYTVGEKGVFDGYGFYGIGTGEASVALIDNTFYTGGYVLGNPNAEAWVDDVKGTPFGGLRQSDSEWVWAKFTPVPIPGAVWLLGGGLVGLLGLRRRFKN